MRQLLILLILGLVMACSNEREIADKTQKVVENRDERPNILLIVVDDMGSSDLGYFGSEIDTPNLDLLAGQGIKLTQFYSAPSCSPTRAMLLTGVDHHRAGLGAMGEFLSVMPNLPGKPGYEGYLNQRVVSLPERLAASGYHTYMTGKWHLGVKEEQSPAARGFEKSFALLDGGGGHFDDLGLMMKPAHYREDGKTVRLPEDFYSTRFYTDKLIDYLNDGSTDDKPWFAYLAFTAPHWPLQAPTSSIQKYADKYRAGYDAIRTARLVRMAERNMLPAGAELHELMQRTDNWTLLDKDAKEREARKMAIYAAMIDDIDQHIGRLIERLKEMGEYNNTLIWFMSDNGPEATDGSTNPLLNPWIEKCCDNSLENMGKSDSYIMYGTEWASISAAPFRGAKFSGFEGGIRVPAFVHFPALFNDGIKIDTVTTVRDVTPTLLELAKAAPTENIFNGRSVEAIQGKSLVDLFSGNAGPIYADDEALGWELSPHRALRRGNWKIAWSPPPHGSSKWELFNLAEDPIESRDLSAEEPTQMMELKNAWVNYVETNGVIVTKMPPMEELQKFLEKMMSTTMQEMPILELSD